MQFLARQGLVLRLHDESEAKFAQLMEYKSEDDPDPRKWLSTRVYTSSKEILSLLSHSVVCEVVDFRSPSQLQFSVIMDRTQDLLEKEQ